MLIFLSLISELLPHSVPACVCARALVQCPLFSFSACRCGTLSASTRSFSASWYLISWRLEPICNGSPLFPTRQRSYPAILHDQGLIHQCSVESLLIILALAYFVPIHPRECGHISSDKDCLLVFPYCYRCSIPRSPTSNLGASQKGLR